MTTTRRELAPRYDAASVEPALYERWMESGAFTPAPEPPPGADRFVVTQPPPNVTGALHLGHALTATVEDAFVRYHRMRGDDTLWLPGVDHASIAAQFVLDRIIAEEGESRASLGRERYLERMWQFMDETRDVIGEQHRRLGASLDWTRLRFTMDDFSARAVRVAFKRLWDAGLVYRGEALVNWCPRCRTTISDLENIHREETGTLWTVRYHLAREDGTPDPDRWISVATTRPETILGDTAVAVHPDDDRYRDLVGREAILPFVGRRLPIVADPSVQREFGTGAVKITPAHDFDDYELGRRHGLPMISVLDEAARMNENGGEFAGLDRFEARAAIVERLREMGDLEGERPHEMVIGHCEKCDTVVEPRLSVQWFIRTKPLAERALASVTEGRTRIIPAHFEKVYAHWMENIHDWAVGRQLWWGHRIPAWFCPDGHVTVSDRGGRTGRLRGVRSPGIGAHPGDRHLRHVVQLRAVAVQHARLARRDPGSPALLPDQRHGDRVRDPLLLGRADDDARPLPDRCRAVPHGLPARDRPRPDGREDEQDEGQRRRPARDDQHDRRGRAALRPRLRQRARRRPAPHRCEAHRRPELHEQAVERRSLRPGSTAGADGRARRPMRPSPRDGSARGSLPRPSERPGSSTTSISPATRRRSTRRPGATTATGSSRWPRSTCDAPTRRMRTGPPPGSRRPTGSPRSCGSSIRSCRS